MDQNKFISIFCARPQNFAWFLGAGASRSSGLPTASDIIWDLKLRHYCREENQDISQQDIQNHAVRARIQAFMDSRGFPPLWADDEYTVYFEKIFGDDKERQRRYINAILSEDKVTLTVGNRVLGALVASGLCRILFTTNFDSIVEKAVAEVSGQSLAAYHLEGSHVANKALNNEEFPIYSKLHGDFRYDTLKNLSSDLAVQNAALSECLINAGNRFGFVVVGYSGRDKSIMELLEKVLEFNNPFPHGLYWLGIKGIKVPPVVTGLLEKAKAKGINADYVEIETFDAVMLRLWRNTDNKQRELDSQVRRTRDTAVSISLPRAGNQKPLIRLNALPIISKPQQCLELLFNTSKSWKDLFEARNNSDGNLIFTKAETVWCWGTRDRVKKIFGTELSSIQVREVPLDLNVPENLHVKGFIADGLCVALARAKPLLCRSNRTSSFLVIDPHADDQSQLDPLYEVVGKESGIVKDLYAPVTEEYPNPEEVSWAEALRVSIELKDEKLWILIDPDIWIWPPRARKSAADFMAQRRSDRYNKKHSQLIDAWIKIILDEEKRNSEINLSAFDAGYSEENPSFCIGNRSAFSRRLT